MSVANRVTYFLEDFILEDGKVGYGGAYLAGKGVVGYAVFVQIPGNLIEVAADPAVLGCQLPDSGKQLVIDRRHMDNRAYGRPPYRLPEKFGLADTIGRKPRCEVGILIFGQPGFHNAAAVGRVVFLSHPLDTKTGCAPKDAPCKKPHTISKTGSSPTGTSCFSLFA